MLAQLRVVSRFTKLVASAAVLTAVSAVVACGSSGNGDGGGGTAGVVYTGGTTPGTGGSGTINPNGGNVNPGGGNVNPNGGNVNPNGGSVNPGGGSVNPGGGSAGLGMGGSTVGMIGGDGKALGDTSCGAGVTMTRLGQCSAQTKGKGTTLTFANFEDPGADNDYKSVVFGDGRAGKFVTFAPAPQTGTFAIEQGTGPGGPSRVAHYSGPAPGAYSATLYMEPAKCYDATAYRGVSFYLKGNPGAGNTHVKVSLHTPLSQPEGADAMTGGGCSAADSAAGKCYDHYATYVEVKADWTRYNIKWSDFKQNCASNLPPGYNPAQYIIGLSFSTPNAAAGFDYMIDNITLEPGDLGDHSNGLTDIVSKDTFEEMWVSGMSSLRNPFYTYEDMTAVAGGYAGFCTTGDATTRRFECAAFFANVGHETDSLSIIDENCNAAGKNCAVYDGGANYHGRGPIQLTGAGNYNAAGAALGAGDLGSNPGQLSTNAPLAWKTGFWFWMNMAGAGSASGHASITNGGSAKFGETIRSINGAVECGGQQPAEVQNRIRLFKRFSYMFGLDPGDVGLGC